MENCKGSCKNEFCCKAANDKGAAKPAEGHGHHHHKHSHGGHKHGGHGHKHGQQPAAQPPAQKPADPKGGCGNCKCG